MKQSPVVRLLRGARAVVSDDAQVRQDVMLGNMRRLRWLIPVFLAFDLLMWAVFSLADPPLSPLQYEWSRAVIRVYVGTSVWLVLVWLFFMTVVQRTQFGRAARLLQAVAPLTLLVFTAVLAALDQKITPSITPYLLGCLSVSLLFLLPPVVTIGLAASGYAVLFVGIGLTQPDPALLLTNRGNGLAVALLSLVLSLVLWRRNTQYLLLQRELSERNRALERQQDELVRLATRDELTGLYNRREFMRLAEHEIKRAQRHGDATSAIVLDLDHFKAVNDRFGHPAGDMALAHVAQCLIGGVRSTDLVARIGGEEFIALLPRTDIDAATGLANKLRRLLQQSPAPVSRDLQIPMTASFGVGCLPSGGDGTFASLYAAADKALYDAKRLGRDRVERAEPDASLTPSDFQRMRR